MCLLLDTSGTKTSMPRRVQAATPMAKDLFSNSWACGKFTHQGVAEQNVWWYNGGPGFEVFPNCLSNGDRAQVYVFNNTSYGNAQDPKHLGSSSDLLLGNIKPISEYGSSYSVFDNIVVSTEATSGNAGKAPVYTAAFWLTNGATFSLVSATGNIFWQSNPGKVDNRRKSQHGRLGGWGS